MIRTERRHPRAARLDTMPAPAVVRLLAREQAAAARRVAARAALWAGWADAIAARMARGGRWILVGAGTSGRLCAMTAAEVIPTFGSEPGRVVGLMAGGPDAFSRTVEGAEDDLEAGAKALRRLKVARTDAVLGVSAGGRTPFVRGALAEARRRGAWTALLSHRELGTGAEVIAGSTRLTAGTATKIVLDLVSTAAFVRLGVAYGPYMVGVRPTSEKLRRRARRMVEEIAGVSAAAAKRLLATARDVRAAVVMARRSCTAEQATRILKAAGGSLRRALYGVTVHSTAIST